MLRPEPGASATLARARALALEAFAVPLFAVEPLAWTAPDPSAFDGLLLTSGNAIRHAGPELRKLHGLPVHAVGAATAEAAAAAGLTVATVGTGGIEKLLGRLPPGLHLLHLCGEHRRSAEAWGGRVTPVPVYRSAAIASPPDLHRLEDAVALVHSPRAGRRLAQLVRRREQIAVAAISAVAGEACGGGWQEIGVAEQPTDDAVLSLAASLCKRADPE
ncbi:MAG: Uroporphyrinogen-III synthase [uncultured Sphingomonas sp.]|uniref:Uroporphyrinogen-III synthase n=1 Tax=uncultured Sphingomonas sp. TaxID=158754 RepID=A0A6J4SJW5_9SPHN|nr:MAG: Uroporphyrinogen-III synthase [uncultured Sphingomonas sp.]